jgi:hypothetical protein
MAVGRPPAYQVEADADHKEEQERTCGNGSPPGQVRGDQGYGDGEFGYREEQSEGGRQPSRQPEIDDGPARSGAIGQLGKPSGNEHCGEQQARDEECGTHNGPLSPSSAG